MDNKEINQEVKSTSNSRTTIVLIVCVVLLVIVLGGVVLFFTLYKGNFSNVKNSNNYEQAIIDEEKNTDKKISLKEYEGYYGEKFERDLMIFYVDENTIDFEYGVYRIGGIKAKNVKINEYGNGHFVEKGNEINEDVDITLKNGKVYLRINECANSYLIEEPYRNAEFTKTSTNIVTKEEILKEINKIISNNYSNINKDVFDVYSNTDNYLTLVLKPTCYIYEYDETTKDKYFTEDGYMHYYTIDKTKGKLIYIKDLFNNDSKKIKKVNDYIKKEIEKQKSEWHWPEDEDLSWPYDEFIELGALSCFENYFLIDENNSTVNIRCLPYPAMVFR